jgi:hypothetical protein
VLLTRASPSSCCGLRWASGDAGGISEAGHHGGAGEMRSVVDESMMQQLAWLAL